jgi:hypothetical protein
MERRHSYCLITRVKAIPLALIFVVLGVGLLNTFNAEAADHTDAVNEICLKANEGDLQVFALRPGAISKESKGSEHSHWCRQASTTLTAFVLHGRRDNEDPRIPSTNSNNYNTLYLLICVIRR